MRLTTLCYIEKDDSYLMLHRIVKKKDINKDKWIGVLNPPSIDCNDLSGQVFIFLG